MRKFCEFRLGKTRRKADKKAVQEAMKRWRLARDEADAIMEADATPERH